MSNYIQQKFLSGDLVEADWGDDPMTLP